MQFSLHELTHAPDQFVALIPKVCTRASWRAIMGVGNVFRHDYDNVAEEHVWRTVPKSLDQLMAVVAFEMERLSDSP
jgi:uncharacterized protein with HEPN domain